MVNIIAAPSSKGTIRVVSGRFISTVKYKNGEMEEKIQERWALSQFIFRLGSSYPIPRIVPFLAIFLTGVGWKLIGAFVVIIFALSAIIFATLDLSDPSSDPSSSPISQYSNLILAIGILFRLKYTWSAKSWHGAAHMAVATYRESGSTEVEEIKHEGHVQGQCRSRFLFPIILASFLAYFFTTVTSFPDIVFYFVILELMLWIDKFVGLENVPVFSHFSTLFQRYVATGPPGDQELLTAQCAVKNLVKAHQGLNFESSSL